MNDFDDVSNSTEVEQQTKQENNWKDFADCSNDAEVQMQDFVTGTVTNTDGDFDEVSNTAEIEQLAHPS